MITKTIFCDAGHSLYTDRGVIHNGIIENDEARKVRDILIPLLEKQFKVYKVPDQFGLQDTVKWVNGVAKKINDGLALSIHLNSNGGEGAECFYHDWSLVSGNMATKLINKYCEVTGLNNRGPKPDRQSAPKALWWIKGTNCWALLLEMCFVDNKSDMDYFLNNREQVAQAIYESVCAIYNIPILSDRTETKNRIAQHLGSSLKLLEQL